MSKEPDDNSKEPYLADDSTRLKMTCVIFPIERAVAKDSPFEYDQGDVVCVEYDELYDLRDKYKKLWQAVVQASGVGGESTYPLDVAVTHLDQLRRSRDSWKSDCEREAMNTKYWQVEYERYVVAYNDAITALASKGEPDMQPKQYDSRCQPIASLTEADLEPIYNKPDSITEALEKECMETMYAVEETEKLLCDIVMKYIGEPPQPNPVSEPRPKMNGTIKTTIQGLRDMRAKLSVMRADVARLI